MAKASVIASKTANELAALKEQLDRIEAMVVELLKQKAAKQTKAE
jgi:hypothetical protein